MAAGLIQRGVDALRNNVNLVKSGIEDSITTKLRSNADAKYYDGQDPKGLENLRAFRNQVLKSDVKGEYRPFIQDMQIGSRFTAGATGPSAGTYGQSAMPGGEFNERWKTLLPKGLVKDVALSKYGAATSPANINMKDTKGAADNRSVLMHEMAHQFFDKKAREDPHFAANFARAIGTVPDAYTDKQRALAGASRSGGYQIGDYPNALTEAYAYYVSGGHGVTDYNHLPKEIQPYYYWMKN